MSSCKKCKKEIPDGAMYCPWCGAPQKRNPKKKMYQRPDGLYEQVKTIDGKRVAFRGKTEKEVLDKNDFNNIAISVQQAIFTQNTARLQEVLEKFMIESVSFYDAGNEGFYHGLLLGLCAILSNRYYVRSNGESGYGRFDVQLIPKIKSIPGFIFEFKHAKTDSEDLSALAREALNQIIAQKYETQMQSQGISEIVKIGIAFRGKKASVERG